MYLLDTDHLTLLEREGGGARFVASAGGFEVYRCCSDDRDL